MMESKAMIFCNIPSKSPSDVFICKDPDFLPYEHLKELYRLRVEYHL